MSTWNKHYHWKTKNATPWTKEYFTRTLVGTSYELSSPTKGSVTVDSISHFDGDVELGNRKGRLITIYDCQMTLEWSGKLDSGTEAKGAISFPEVSHEVQDEGEEYKYSATMSSSSSVETQALLEAVRSHLAPSLLPHFHQFRDELVASHARDLGHDSTASPSGGESASASGVSTPVSKSAGAAISSAASSESKPAEKKPTSALSTTNVTVEAELSIRRDDLWDLLTNPGRIPMWTRAPAQLTLNPGSTFSLFNGNITGSVLEVEAPTMLKQKWRAPQWPADHFGTLTTTLNEGSSFTALKLDLEGVPLEEEERSKDALDRFYLAGLKGLGLGTGALI